MDDKLERVKQLVELNPISEGLLNNIDIAWAIHRKGVVPENYLVCPDYFWPGICQIFGYIPARINCADRGRKYIAFEVQD